MDTISTILLIFSISTFTTAIADTMHPFRISTDDTVFKYPRDSSTGSVDVVNNLELNIFCRDAEPKLLVNYFRTAKMRFVSSKDVKVFKGPTPAEVRQNYLNRPKWPSMSGPYWGTKEASLLVFNSSCVGVSAEKPYAAVLSVQPIDFRNVALLFCGLMLFTFGDGLSRSTTLFYLSVCFIGAFAFGILILIFMTRILMQMKQSAITISMLWGLCLYYFGGFVNAQSLEDTFSISLQHLMTYLTIGATVTFLICYRIGPPTNSRTLDIIKWIIQISGLLLIYTSSEYVETSLTIIGLSLLFYNAQKFVHSYSS